MLSKNKNDILAECLRCGTCCQQGGPALHNEDLQLVGNSVLPFAQLVTVRREELAHDPLQNKVLPSGSEFIKIKGQGNSWSCAFFDQVNNGCFIYRTRPLECRLLFCRNTAPVEKIMGCNLLFRQQLLSENDPVLPLIDRQELEVSYRLVNKLLAGIDDGFDHIKDQLTDLVSKDLAIRDDFLRNFSKRQHEELFLFGRP